MFTSNKINLCTKIKEKVIDKNKIAKKKEKVFFKVWIKF